MTAPTPAALSEPMSDERLAEIRRSAQRFSDPFFTDSEWARDVLELLAEVTRLRAAAEAETDVSVICRECGFLISGVEAGDRVRFVTCRACRAPHSPAAGASET